jgi:flagellar FliL protein
MADQRVAEIKDDKGPAGESPKAKKGKKGLILLIGGLFFLAAIGSIFFFAPSILPEAVNPFKKGDASPKEKRPEPAKQGHIYSLESMIVNLADTEFQRYLKVKMDIESEKPKPDEEFEKRLPQLKDAIITILTSKTFSDISESKGKMQLKEEIILKANQLFETFKVKTIYFTEFVVQ